MSNKSYYNGVRSVSSVPVRGPDTPQYHIDLVTRHMRRLLALGHTIEDGLDLVLEAARREFQCRILVVRPSAFLVDGGEFIWPLTAPARQPASVARPPSNEVCDG
jgi:hypothetical protein